MTEPSAFTLPAAGAQPARADPPVVVVVGGGPAGLMASERLARAGVRVELFDAMPSVGRKFLLAGRGGLNLTHAEPHPAFVGRYAGAQDWVAPWLERVSPQALRDWAEDLGIPTFVGSSGKVFPAEMKAAPLLRAWLHRLREVGVRFHMRHRWLPELAATPLGAGRQPMRFSAPAGEVTFLADAVVLALGGASWSRLGSDGAWVGPLQDAGVAVAPLRPSNCGFDLAWSPHLSGRFAGEPLKSVVLRLPASGGSTDAPEPPEFERLGECVLTAHGLEGSLVYAASALLRERIARDGFADIELDLLPARPLAALTESLARGRGARSLANHLREQAGLSGVRAGLLREGLSTAEWNAASRDPAWLAARIKALPLRVLAPRPIDEAISSAGGVEAGAVDAGLQLQARPGVFCAGEMLDWEAPTGGYLLTAAMASGVVAADGVLALLETRRTSI